jgi:hypothetical protein
MAHAIDWRERFMAKVAHPDSRGCVLWTGAKDGKGYGQFCFGKKRFQAHRVAYEKLVGPISEGLQIDHLCRRRACVNPAHLEPVTPRVNYMRGIGQSAINAMKTHCPRGHPLSDENLLASVFPKRVCLTCTNARTRAHYHRNRAAILISRAEKRANRARG